MRSIRVVLFLVLMLALPALACSFSSANISDAYLSRDDPGEQRTSIFAPTDDTFYAQVDLANAPDDTTVRAVWTAVAVAGEEPNLFLDETELTSGDGRLTFSLSNDNLWPIGDYKVDLYLNGELDQTLSFNVQE